MTKTLIWSVALIVSAVILATGSVEAPPQPKVTEVTGTVSVDNFPVTPTIRFRGLIGLTPNIGVLPMSRLCHNTYPESRLCNVDELALGIPPAPEFPFPGVVFVTVRQAMSSSSETSPIAGCAFDNGEAVVNCPNAPMDYPAACCGF